MGGPGNVLMLPGSDFQFQTRTPLRLQFLINYIYECFLTYLCGEVGVVFICEHFILASLGENQAEEVDAGVGDEEGGQVGEDDLLLAWNKKVMTC